MRLRLFCAVLMFVTAACGGSPSPDPAPGSEPASAGGASEPEARAEASGGEEAPDNEFQIQASDTAGQARGERPSEIEPTRTHAAMRLFVVNPDTGPLPGIVIKMSGADGSAYYTRETDSVGYAEVLVPIGQRYQIEYLSLGRRSVSANVEVPDAPNQNIRLTMRYRRQRPAPAPRPATPLPEEEQQQERFVLDGVLFGTGSARIEAESFPRLDQVVEYMTHRPSVRIRIAGHTDNVGNPQRNLRLSEQRAQSVRTYLIEQGIDGDRIEAVGYGDERPVASNATEEGQRQNRRIEAVEL